MTNTDAPEVPPRARDRLGLLRHPDFLKLWTAETISVFGTQVTNLALPLVAAQILLVTPFEFGLLGTIEMLPFVLLTLPAGVWVDRVRRRPVLIAGDAGRAIALASIPLAAFTGVLSLPQLYVVGFVVGVLAVFFDVAYQSYLPSVVERDRLIEGNAKLEVSRSSAQVVGPGLAGALIGLLTAPFAIVIDAASFAISALFIGAIRRPEPAPERAPAATREASRTAALRSFFSEVREGLRYVLGHPWLRSIALTTGISNFFGNLWGGILILYLVRERGMDAATIGLAFSIGSTGVLLAALTAGRLSALLGVGRTLVLAALGFSLEGIPVVLAPDTLVLAATGVAIFLGGFSGVVWNVNQVSLRQAITPAPMLGRMNATMRFIVWGTIPFGALAGGALGQWLGLHQAVLLGAAAQVVGVVPVALSSVRRLERIPEPETIGEPGSAGERSA